MQCTFEFLVESVHADPEARRLLFHCLSEPRRPQGGRAASARAKNVFKASGAPRREGIT